jgi:hypothetical protein
MRGAKIFWVLFKTIIFTALVPGTVGLWIPYRIRLATRPPDVIFSSFVEMGAWPIFSSLAER